MAPLALARDDALALSRAIGQVVMVVTPLRTVVGVMRGVDTRGVISVGCGLAGDAFVPMSEVTSWSLFPAPKSKKGAPL